MRPLHIFSLQPFADHIRKSVIFFRGAPASRICRPAFPQANKTRVQGIREPFNAFCLSNHYQRISQK